MNLKYAAAMLLALVFSVTVAVAPHPAAAQDDWFAYVFNQQSMELVKVHGDGTAESFSLGLPVGAYASADDLAFSYDASVVAFCYLLNTDSGSYAHLVVRDVASQTNMMDVELGQYVGCHVGKNGFGFGGMTIFVGLANDPTNGRPAWELRVIEPFGGTSLFTLDASMPEAAVIEAAGGPMLPIVFQNDSQQVTFGVIPYGIGGAVNVNAYSWPLVGELTPVDYAGNYGADTLQYTGEKVWPEVDENLPAGNPGGPLPGFNVVKYLDRDGNVNTIYHSPDWTITDVTWVNGGQQVAISLLAPFDENNPVQSLKTILIGRDGSQQEVDGNGAGMVIINDSVDGYVTMVAYFPTTADGVYHAELTRTANGETRSVWAYDGNDAMGAWTLVWAPPSEFANNFDPIPALN